jgi:hypothetical protein
MKFECGDLERALEVPELMREAREHLRECASCRRELKLWNDISVQARELHEEWDSPDLWARIRQDLDSQPKARKIWWNDWRVWTFAASIAFGAVMLFWVNTVKPSQQVDNRDFLTDQALKDVESTETAYRRSIDNLYRLASPKLEHASTPLTVAYREKLLLIDSAINDVRNNLQQNRFNTSLQTELAALYREKQRTLEDVLTHDQKN